MKRICCFLLGCVLLLTGCSGKKDDHSLYEAASGIGDDEILLTVDGREIPAFRYLYWLTWNCDYLESVGALEGGWGQTLDGVPLAEYVKEQALQTTVLYAVIENWAETCGCVLSDEDRQAMEEEWTRLCLQYGGEETCLQSLAWMGLDREGADAFTADYYLYGQLNDLFRTEGSVLWPGQEALTAYAEEAQLLTVDVIFVSGTGEAENGERRERAEMILSRLQESADPAGYFSTLAGAYSDDPDRDSHPEGGTCAAGDGTLPQALEEAALSLAEGTWSGVLEADGGFYILLRRPLNMTDAAGMYFNQQLRQAVDEAQVETGTAYQQLDAEKFREALILAREDLDMAVGAFSAVAPAE